MKDIQGFIDWVNAKPGKRQVDIKIGEYVNADHYRAWAYDYELIKGQFVTEASEINIDKIVADKEKAEYEKLKAKFEGER